MTILPETTPRIYVACLASYNAGKLHGRWIDATTDVDAMQADVDAMLRDSPEPNVTVPCPDCDGSGEMTFHNSETGDTRKDSCPHCRGTGAVSSAEEFAIHDSEGLGELGEYAGLGEVAKRVAIIDLADDRGIPAAVLLEYAGDYMSGDYDADDLESQLDDSYDGQAESWADFAQERVEETDSETLDKLPDWLRFHIDWDGVGRDWSMSGDWSAYMHDGTLYFFRTC